jgi:hypothetical protein
MKIIFFIVFIFSFYSFADGPPVDKDGNILIDHLSFYLDAEQLKHIESNNYLVFNNDQVRILQNINPQFPKQIYLLSPFYNDCTCGMIYAIWNKSNQVGIAIEEIINYQTIDIEEINSELSLSDTSNQIFYFEDSTATLMIYFGINGDIYINHKSISENDLFIESDKYLSSEKIKHKYLIVRRPPQKDKLISSKIESTIKKIELYSKNNSINLWISG